MCGVRTGERIGISTLLENLNLPNLESTLLDRRIRWLGHVLRSDGWIRRSIVLQMEGQAVRGGPRKNWHGLIKEDLKIVGLTKEEALQSVNMLNKPSNRANIQIQRPESWTAARTKDEC